MDFLFYETLLVKSIPIQQVRKDILNKYTIESKFDDCIYFYDINELPEKIKNLKYKTSYNELWLEELLKNDNLL